MAKVKGSPFGEDEHPILGGAVQWHPSGNVQVVTKPRNPKTKAQQEQRLRLAEGTEAIRLVGPTWRNLFLENVSTLSIHKWHQLWVGTLAFKRSRWRDLRAVFLSHLNAGGLASWESECRAIGMEDATVPGAGIVSPSQCLLLLIAFMYESQAGFGAGIGSPSNSNAAAWVAAYVS